jgi:hypothetical protein
MARMVTVMTRAPRTSGMFHPRSWHHLANFVRRPASPSAFGGRARATAVAVTHAAISYDFGFGLKKWRFIGTCSIKSEVC